MSTAPCPMKVATVFLRGWCWVHAFIVMRKTMKKTLTICTVGVTLLLSIFTASIQASQYEIAPCDSADGCRTTGSLWFYGGHVEAGIYGNNHGQRNCYDWADWEILFPRGTTGEDWNVLSGNTSALGPARMADLQMNQLYGYFGKNLDKRRGFDVGGRIDFMYGTDAYFTQSNGLEYYYNAIASTSGRMDMSYSRERWGQGDYLVSFPQIYGEVGSRNLSVKIGKFYTPLEGGAIMAPNRFFYSTSYVHGLLPITQSGVLATWEVNPRLAVYGGWTAGDDFFYFGESTFAKADNNAALFGMEYKVNQKIHIGYGALMGQEKDYLNSWGNDHDYMTHKIVFGIHPNLRWDYTFEFVLRNSDFSFDSTGNPWHSNIFGINQELVYKLDRCWSFGLRGEWSREKVTGGWLANFYEMTFGINWTPNKHLLVRPEIRYDYCDGDDAGVRAFKMGTEKDQLGFGTSMVVKF